MLGISVGEWRFCVVGGGSLLGFVGFVVAFFCLGFLLFAFCLDCGFFVCVFRMVCVFLVMGDVFGWSFLVGVGLVVICLLGGVWS